MNAVVEAARLLLEPSRVAVVSGGVSSEHHVSIASGRGVEEAAASLGHDVVSCIIAEDGSWNTDGVPGLSAAVEALRSSDVAIAAMHGLGGEDGTIQGFFETIGVPYVGSGVLSSAMCLDKELTKRILAENGLTVARAVSARGAELDDPRAVAGRAIANGMALPVFVKPARGGSSHGVTRVEHVDALPDAISTAAEVDRFVLIEEVLVGREIDLSVIELPDGSVHAGPSLEILSDPEEPFFTATAKYDSDGTRFEVPAPVDGSVARQLEDAAITAFHVLHCRGLARVDFFVTDDGRLLVNEINTFPGFTPASQYPRMWAGVGIDYAGVVNVLLSTAVARQPH